jgi:alpha-L-rhamnosidase
MKTNSVFLLATFLFVLNIAQAQDVFVNNRQNWLEKAKENIPRLNETIKHPVNIVTIIEDKQAFQHYKAVKESSQYFPL